MKRKIRWDKKIKFYVVIGEDRVTAECGTDVLGTDTPQWISRLSDYK